MKRKQSDLDSDATRSKKRIKWTKINEEVLEEVRILGWKSISDSTHSVAPLPEVIGKVFFFVLSITSKSMLVEFNFTIVKRNSSKLQCFLACFPETIMKKLVKATN